MKKITLAVLCLFVILTSMGFRSCQDESGEMLFYGFMSNLYFAPRTLGLDSQTDNTFGLGVGNNGTIIKTVGNDTINFTYRNSGTTQNLNVLRIQPTTFQPLVITAGNNGTLIRSTDQGETWILRPLSVTSNLFALDISSATQHCAGDNGTLLISYDLGANWMQQSSGTTRNLRGIGMNGGYVIAVGEKGTILRTTNSGQNWLNVSLPDTTINLYCVSQRTRQNFNATNFYIAGSLGKIYKSTDNGATWSLKSSGTTNTLRSIFFSGNDSGVVAGDNGTVRMTTNAGETWFSDPYFNSVTGSITSISQMPRSARTFTAISNNTKLYVASVDSNLVVLGVQSVSSEVPKNFSLSQNYPNPFNPATYIKFAIPKSGFVKLTVFDMLGREIETIINQNLSAGTYKADWNASGYSSGIYFYKLETDRYSKTKKMVLTK